MKLFSCRGCEAKDGEIRRLTHANTELLNRCLALTGQVPLAPLATGTQADEGPDPDRELTKTIEQMDAEAEDFLRAEAERRGLDPGEFADA